jgi:hypothetical protein
MTEAGRTEVAQNNDAHSDSRDGPLRSHPSRAPDHTGPLTRRGSACLMPLVLVALVFASGASATPTVTLKARAIPIPGFPGTGNILGAGTEAEIQVTIAGSEYGGFPSPLTGIKVYAPLGLKVTPTGFATCASTVLEVSGAAGCPKQSNAGPQGVGLGIVSFGNERVPEQVVIHEFFAPGGLTFYVEGHTPSSFEFLEPAHWTTAPAPYGPELIVEVPLIETVPGGNDASVLSFRVKVGAAYKKGKRTVSYLTQPKHCPKRGFPVKLELKFLSGETAMATASAPCPPH